MEVTSPAVPSPGASANGVTSSPTFPTIEPERVVEHLASVCEVALGATRDELGQVGSLLHKSRYSETISRCTRFASDTQNVLYIQKDFANSSAVEPGADPSSPVSYNYTLSTEISSSPTTVASLVLIKSPQPIDPARPLTSQIFITNLPGPASLNAGVGEQGSVLSPWEVLHSQVHHALVPYFDANTKSQQLANGSRGRADVDAKTGIPVTKKRLNDLELSLLHLQQNVDIPEISLTFHSIVQNVLDEAEAHNNRPSIDGIPQNLLQDSTFLNRLQANVNTWIKSIQGITKLTKDPSSNANQEFSTASQEVNFWLSMESALEGIEGQLRSEGVLLTLEILKHAKRFQATVSFTADTGLKEAMDKVQKYNQLMRDFPLDELLSATSLPKVGEAIHQIFSHLNKKLRICPYPIRRALPLVEAISADLDDVLHRLLTGTELVNLDYQQFKNIMQTCDQIFQIWEENVKEFTNVAREVTRRRNEKFIPIKIVKKHSELEARIKYVSTFRDNHEQLQRTIVTVLGPQATIPGVTEATEFNGIIVEEIGNVDAVEEVKQAWEALQNVDLLDVTDQGKERWVRAENLYNERTTRVENSIIRRLRERLATAKTANEMFRVFSKFNALFVRPKIRGAIQEYQNQLMDQRFKQQYGHSETHAMAQLRDLPPVSGAIIWARQIEFQLDGYMRKVEAVLGPDWTLHAEGHKLQEESELFKQKLDTSRIYDAWLNDVGRRKISISGQLFDIARVRSAGGILELAVNFDPQVITLFKETRNLTWQSYSVPHAVTTVSKDAKRVYPYAVSLMESVRTLSQTLRQISAMGEESVLLNGYRNDVYRLIGEGVPLRWESFINSHELFYSENRQTRPLLPGGTDFGLAKNTESKHGMFIRGFAAAVSVLQQKAVSLNFIHTTVEQALKELNTCPYDEAAFHGRLDTIQSAVDQLNLEQYVNLDFWVRELNAKIQSILLTRLQSAVHSWIAAFEDDTPEEETRRKTNTDETKSETPTMKRLVLEVVMRNQVIYLDPPLEFARASWFLHLHEWLGIVCNLRKIKATRYQMSLTTAAHDEARFTDLPTECAGLLQRVYISVEKKLQEISAYVDKWLQFQSLWDLQSEQVYDALGEPLPRWLQLLQDLRKNRSTFDTQEVSREFGHLTVDYDQVQTKVNAKYDQWQHEILMKFASRLGNRMRDINAEIEKARKHLESQSSDASSTAQAVQFITVVQSCKRNVKTWAPEIDMFRQGQSMLVRQRYQFPNDWLHIEQIDSQWEALKEILEKKSRIVQEQSDALRAKITAEDKLVNERIAEIAAQWNEEKPVSGTIQPDVASATLSSFEARISKLQDDAQMVVKAKEALDIPASMDTSLESTLEEVRDFQSVWSNLSTIWASLNETRDILWTAVQPRKIRSKVDDLIKSTKDMPSRMRQYAAFEHVQGILRGFLKVNPILSDLKSDAIRERHWVKIYKQIKPQKRFSPSSMTLGDVWDLNLIATEVIVKDIIAQAQGEMALEEFLKQVRETWQNYALEMVNYQNKIRLIRGWDDLFAKCSENLNSLQAMKHSPYYKEFEEEAVSWEDKLNRVHVLFDVWIDVQRQWVYLEGVFTGNADIKHLLPIESGRFQNINSEFLAVMKKANKSPYVLEVLNIPNVQKSLERLAEMLNKIQKALGEYLEKERVSFPRFYFVGDEDLLEMIGNSNDTLRIAKHFKKMFAGLSGLVMDDETVISGFTSKEGEVVRLKKEISLAKTPKINDWLALLEGGMKLTLAELLAEAVDHYTPIFESEKIDRDALNAFMDAYPSQIVVLATQVAWTTAVEQSLSAGGSTLKMLFDREVEVLRVLADTVLGELEVILRKKCEQLITECVHQRDTIEKLINANANSTSHYLWQLQMRYIYNPDGEFLDRLYIKMANAKLNYGFEYLGVPERLVRTPLTDRCFLTLTQALCQRLGGSPYGPAGTAMGRIFLGICQVGAWGCFDEFNRLEERILSAVSQQIQNIQLGLKQGAEDDQSQIELVGRQLHVNENTGIFITMNPGYAGRSNLPDNLKKLFRSVAMSKPDKELIAEVMLYSQGFNQAKQLSKHTVPFFDQCSGKLSKQAHYDFGLRALKSVLVSSGGLKRARLGAGSLGAEEVVEPEILVQSIRETIAPKLIKSDVDIMMTIEADCFPGVQYVPANLVELEDAIRTLAAERHLVVNELWMTKVLQLYQIQKIHHGVMMVGNSGSGKSAAWRLLLDALQKVEGVEGVSHVIDSKVMSKEALYGNLDSTTREWTDGLFTSILRKIVDNLRGEDSKRHWIVFDGDVDPEWVENLNSVLDDNKLLTLPNGERLNLPSNVRIISVPFEDLDEDSVATGQNPAKTLSVQSEFAASLRIYLTEEDLILQALKRAEAYNHIMEFTVARVLTTLFSLLNKAVRDAIEYNGQHSDFPLESEQIEAFISKKLLLALVWALTGDCPLNDRKAFGDELCALANFGSPPLDGTSSLIDFDVTLPKSEWAPWQNQVPSVEVNTHSITQTDVVIPTLDTVRHEDVLYSWLAEHKPLLLCGPPGSGKTMTLFSALRKLPNMEVVGLNFSSATTPDLLIKTFEQYCEYKKTLNGVMLSPTQIGRWLVVFCDEINLPAPDKYGTQRAISFLRQMVEHNGFWRTSDKSWVTLDRIQFVGACNPPTDAGRTPMGARFLRHAPLIMVDYPGELSLNQIYGTFNSAVLKIVPSLRGYSEALTHAMDRLVAEDERQWTDESVRRIALEYFPNIDEEKALGGPILFSNWLSKNYVPVDREQLRDFVKARLKTFCEEEVDVPLILFNDVLEHVLRIDRVFRQPQGHLILIGVSGSGKTTLSRFVAWMNGLKVFQIKVHGKYSAEDFDDDLRDVLRRCGCKACKEGAQRQNLHLDSPEELYKWFTQQIVKNLHVVFTMNPPEDGLSSKAATSPALFNRCVLNWFGDWSDQALFQVGHELTQSIDLDRSNFECPDTVPVAYRGLQLPPSHRETVVNSMVYIHYSLQRYNEKLFKQQGKVTFLTPRHFLDFVAQYVKLYNEKREDLEEQQRHLNVGLEKLRDTVDKVRDLRVSLAEKKKQLEQKDAEANEKLQRMVADQRLAEQEKTASLEIQAALDKQEVEVASRKKVVLEDLAKAEPAVEEAKASVSNIKRQHLTEVRSMGNPPQGVRLAMDAVCTLLGHRINDWKAVQGIVRKDDFIASILMFDNARQMTKALRNKMRNDFLSNPEFTFEKVNRASKACGPLVQWVSAQVNYFDILDRVGPLKLEVEELEEKALNTKADAKAVQNKIADLESSINRYKTEYAALISETQSIKAEMSKVQFKVDRSVRLLDSLSSERVRWEEGSKSFEIQISTLVGDVLVAAAFLAYSGLYDQTFRKLMMDDWFHQLHLSEFLQRECKDRRLTVTSFLDDTFTKQLESSLRFGNPILIQDAEHLDPILNHVLNKEYQKTGGRVLIQLGKQEIDFSPAFKIYLSTRDPSATFAPDICSRTTFVNFTVTQSSLQTQSLNDVLKSERPDVDERRSNLIKLQGEFKVHLRQLEKRLLQALNESRGNILDDDNVIETLETLKTEAAEISGKMSSTEGVMAEVEEITQQYSIVARSCSAVFAVLEQLHYLNHFYQFSLQYFLDIFQSVLHGNKNLAGQTDHNVRRDVIASPYKMDKSLIDIILDNRVEGKDLSSDPDERDQAFTQAKKIGVLKEKLDAVSAEDWDKFFTEELAENAVPQIWDDKTELMDQALLSLLLVKLFRMDRFVPAAERFVNEVFGSGIFDVVEDLKETVTQVSATLPISLVSSPGFDASYKVDNLVERMRVKCTNIAMGSNEGLASADKAISNAAQTGSWVLVKNVHLAPTWLQSLEKRMGSLNPHSDFRLFLSMESSPKIPVNLLRASRVLMYEQPAGVRANMKDSMSSLSTRATKSPVERTRLYLLLSFLHAVVQERLRYAPNLGWRGFWEFNDSDYECSAFIVDTWIDGVAGNRTNIAPQNIPWEMLRYMVTETYGGKIDNEGDFRLLSQLVTSFLTPAAYEVDHKLVDGPDGGLVVPSGTNLQDFNAWIHRLPEREPPTYLGLPANAEKLLLGDLGRSLIGNVRKVTELLDEGEQLVTEV
ncbi:Dynein heavy chain, cytoplasmic [Fusarium oxysporum f. sp. cubense race 1]|uniref:Dynein heavy chain, cytoplasmic n=1 Tax=Fusarium oxysporum f. sp. cubense (strain race 1) TaxID=1229664 RepID=N4UF19_FUSC1|nr:Dynein heavy chain, cytoplasmic [Fusarium oxysporum f. sp. cubense race 1]